MVAKHWRWISLGAVLATETASGMTAGTHGSTYGGNPLACAVGAESCTMWQIQIFLLSCAAKQAY